VDKRTTKKSAAAPHEPISLKESEAMLRTILENTRDSYVLYDKKGIILAFNEAAKEQYLTIHGTHLETGKSVYEMTPPDRHDLAREVFNRCFKGETFELEVNRVAQSGIERWFKSSYHPVKSTRGEVIAVSVKSTEITNEITVQSSIKKSEATLRALIENTKEAFILFSKEGSTLAYNHVAVELYRNHNKRELKEGTTIYDLIIPERHEPTKEIFEKVLSGEPFERIVSNTASDGKKYYFKRFFSPVRNEEGEIYAVANTITDITSEIEATEAIRTSEANLRALFDNAQDGFVLLSTSATILAFNHAAAELYKKMFSKTLEVGRSAADVLGPQIGEYVRSAFKQVLAGESFERKSKQLAVDGKEYWLRGYYNPVKSPEGNIIGICMGIADITVEMESESRLRESEERFRTVANTAPVMIWMTGTDKKSTFFNSIWQKFTGRTIAELIDRWSASLEPDDYKIYRDIYDTAFDGREEFTMEYRLRRHDGEYRWIADHGIPRYGVNDEFLGYIGICTDITERKMARQELEKKVEERTIELREKNEALQRQKEFSEQMIDSSVDLIGVYDKDLRLIAMNKVSEDFIRRLKPDFKKEDMIGKTFHELNPGPESEQSLHDLQLSLAGTSVRKLYSRSQPQTQGRDYEIYYEPIRHKDEVYASLIIIHDITATMDITEKLREKNEELQQQKEFTEQMIDSAVDLITVYDTDTKVITVNKQVEKLLGKERSDIIGKPYLELFPDSKASHTYNNLLKCLAGETTHHVVQRALYSDRSFDIFMIPLRHQGEVYAALVLVHDITDIIGISDKLHDTNKKLEQKNTELARTNKELEQFAYVASHDLQEPLRKIHTFSGRLKEKSSSELDETSRLWIEKIMHSTNRMSNLIKDILDYSRLTVSDADFIPVNLNHTLANVLVDFDLRIAEKNALVESDTLPVVEGIPLYLYQLFHNLVGNGLKFTRSGVTPHICISAKPLTGTILPYGESLPEGKYWEIIFEDNGIGFSPEFSEKIFTIFQRLNERSKFEGTGVGLALCRKIIDIHSGKIFAESREGEGATFHIILPEKQI
jgi:PAS domain S-box-containing protein